MDDVGLENMPVLITKTDGYQKKGILIQLTRDFAKLRYRDGRTIVIPVVQISQITPEVERDTNGR